MASSLSPSLKYSLLENNVAEENNIVSGGSAMRSSADGEFFLDGEISLRGWLGRTS